METFTAWWNGLQSLNQWFFIGAAFFSVFFVWQVVMAFLGLGSGTELDAHVDSTMHHDSTGDADDSVAAFKLLSVRSVVAFFTLFTWAGALYMSKGNSTASSLLCSVLWGAFAMALISLLFYGMRRMTETGNIKIGECVDKTGAVYLDIPADGNGEIRILCCGVLTHLKARSANGTPAKAGTVVKVTKVTGPNSVEIEIDNSTTKGKEKQ